MDLNPTLAFTAVLELHPGGRTMTDAEAKPIRQALCAALDEAKPKDAWAFAKAWIEDYLATTALAEHDAQGPQGPGYFPPFRTRMDYRMALAIARSAHPSRVLAHTGCYRYGRFTEVTIAGQTAYVCVVMMGTEIARFFPTEVQLFSGGHRSPSTSEALSNLVTGGYFYHRDRVLWFSSYRPGVDPIEHREGAPYSYR